MFKVLPFAPGPARPRRWPARLPLGLLLALALPLAGHAQTALGTLSTSQTLAPGTYTFSIAAGQSAKLEGWGGGGRGGYFSAYDGGGGGGGGGAYATLTVTGPATYSAGVGPGATLSNSASNTQVSSGSTVVLLASRGGSGNGPDGGSGGLANNNIPQSGAVSGGNGANNSSGGPAGGTGGAAGGPGGGSGGTASADGAAPGGGGGGGDGYGHSYGSNGGAGRLTITLLGAAGPALTNLNPTNGPVGTSVTLTGTGFTSGSTVSFNGTAATSVTYNSTTSLTAVVPAGASTGNVTVTTALGTSNAVAFVVGTPANNALAFDGVDDYVTTPGTLIAAGSSYTREAWVYKTPGSATTVNIISSNGNTLWLSGGKLAAGHNSSFSQVTAPNAFPEGVWTHVASTYYQPANTLTLYINGAAVASISTANAYTGFQIQLGAHIGGLTWPGKMDEVRIWNRALCAAEIMNNRDKELAPGQNGLVAYYKLNQGIAGGTNSGLATATDASGNGADATLVNFALTGSTSNWVAGTVSGTTAAPFVQSGANTTQAMSGTTTKTFGIGCSEYGRLTPAGTAPVTGNVTAVQTIDASVQSYSGHAYVQRHCDFAAATNPTTATANVTLYFTQAEFTAYNAANGTDADLPTSPTDATGQAALRVTQYHGTPTGGYAPANYPATWGGSGAARVVITPGAANVVWNSTASLWEVTFPITGFSGFFVSGAPPAPLPVQLVAFTAQPAGPAAVRLAWTTASEVNSARFEVERSSDGAMFETVGTVAAAGSSASARAYSYLDAAAPSGRLYYRLRQVDLNGTAAYSPVQTLALAGSALALYPNPAPGGPVTVSGLPAGTAVQVLDALGRPVLAARADEAGQATLALPATLAPGLYLVRAGQQAARLVVE